MQAGRTGPSSDRQNASVIPTPQLASTVAMNPESTVPLGTGLPTREELNVHYPAKFTWGQLKCFVNSGDLGLLKRDKRLQKRYDEWAVGIKTQYGSIVSYLLNYRLQWGKPDTLSLLRSALDDPTLERSQQPDSSNHQRIPEIPPGVTPYFTADAPKELISIIQNDWPYSVPPEVEHSLIWTMLPIFHPDLIAESIRARVEQDGLWGFTGNESPPPSPSLLPTYISALSQWGMTLDKLIRSERGTEEEDNLVKRAGGHIDEFVRTRWIEDEWETAWFVNPPRLQSVPGLAHIHVFARKKI
ncbi:hypothetical protein HGRIS_005758 [Hohenbuehelia grisea]|uniref:Uncharacterized protein n=1 Tax=Hohenbuehelia grisea TaxID=104357 RepID=A0ABR3JYU6_9AGAR